VVGNFINQVNHKKIAFCKSFTKVSSRSAQSRRHRCENSVRT